MTSKDEQPVVENISNEWTEDPHRKVDTEIQNINEEIKVNQQLSEPSIDDKELKKSSKANLEDNENEDKENEQDFNPEPFEQDDIIEDYAMDTLYNKKRVPYIEKNNGSIYLTKHKNYQRAIEHYNKALYAIKLLLEDRNLNVGEKYTNYS